MSEETAILLEVNAEAIPYKPTSPEAANVRLMLCSGDPDTVELGLVLCESQGFLAVDLGMLIFCPDQRDAVCIYPRSKHTSIALPIRAHGYDEGYTHDEKVSADMPIRELIEYSSKLYAKLVNERMFAPPSHPNCRNTMIKLETTEATSTDNSDG